MAGFFDVVSDYYWVADPAITLDFQCFFGIRLVYHIIPTKKLKFERSMLATKPSIHRPMMPPCVLATVDRKARPGRLAVSECYGRFMTGWGRMGRGAMAGCSTNTEWCGLVIGWLVSDLTIVISAISTTKLSYPSYV